MQRQPLHAKRWLVVLLQLSFLYSFCQSACSLEKIHEILAQKGTTKKSQGAYVDCSFKLGGNERRIDLYLCF